MDELISREAVIEIIKRVADGCSYVDIPTDELIQFIQKIPKVMTYRKNGDKIIGGPWFFPYPDEKNKNEGKSLEALIIEQEGLQPRGKEE